MVEVEQEELEDKFGTDVGIGFSSELRAVPLVAYPFTAEHTINCLYCNR